jgi:hypothetical protein
VRVLREEDEGLGEGGGGGEGELGGIGAHRRQGVEIKE